MSATQPAGAQRSPILIYRSVDGDGETYALERRSLDRLRATFGPSVHPRARIFIAHETRADYEHVHESIVPQVVALLTGLSVDRLEPLGGVTFRDPVTERELPRLAS